MSDEGYPLDAGEEVCPVCGLYRGETQPNESWFFHLAICFSISNTQDKED